MRTQRWFYLFCISILASGLCASTSLAQEDFGDLPESYEYPEGSMAPDPAFHIVAPPFMLGAEIDPEPGPQPSPDADEDDNTGLDDEDGVTPAGVIMIGIDSFFDIFIEVPGALDAWIDLNDDGVFQTATEHLIQAHPLTGASGELVPVFIPVGTTPGLKAMRFRLTEQGIPVPTGFGEIGEVEDYFYEVEEPMDFGDLPDPAFQTLLASDGARHIITPLFLGQQIDPEPNGQPDPAALGDDTDLLYPSGGDDEDGVPEPIILNAGQANLLNVTASGSGLLSIWIDLDQSGAFDAAPEQVVTDFGLSAGPNPVTVILPPGLPLGATYARFRFSTVPGLPHFGLAPDGEVEDYEIVIEDSQEELDWGDAPDSYQTVLASSGPNHQIIPAGPMLGIGVDAEPDGQPDPAALGDDNDTIFPPANDDEDAITWSTITLNMTYGEACLPVNTLTGGMLDGWVDWNINGTFELTESLTAPGIGGGPTQLLSPGINLVCFLVPTDAVPGPSFMRLRISGLGGLPPFGPAPDGEIEDYEVDISDTLIEVDFGDAPDPVGATPGEYPTLATSLGAAHYSNSGVYLGTTIDPEPDGIPDPAALGDDLTGIDDEDGINGPVFLINTPGNQCVVVNTASGGELDAWIDWDQSGTWDSDEGISPSAPQTLTAGANTVCFQVPQDAVSGATFARFRISINGGWPPYGVVFDGEVEDYLFEIIDEADMDWGDAPEGHGYTYNTTSGNAGAAHLPGGPEILGSVIDYELDGQPGSGADQDDLNPGPSDEDGLMVPVFFNLTLGSQCVTVNTLSGGFLDAWVDWDFSGYWEADEHLSGPAGVSMSLAPGPNHVCFPIPADQNPATMQTGDSYARFRISPGGGLPPWGITMGGEVEDYLVHIIREESSLDFGDAPDPSPTTPGDYPTLLANNGARHLLSGSAILGQVIDPDADGQPTPLADGDDTEMGTVPPPGDEDGVFPTSSVQAGNLATVDVIVTADPTGAQAFLNAWVDFNVNGYWGDPGEQIFTDEPVGDGVNALSYTVPAGAVTGVMTYARYRLVTAASLPTNVTPLGYADNGEVEDYAFEIEPGSPMDFGDLEDPSYPTLLANNGARHTIVPGIKMGANIDSETDGNPHPDALGDDNHATDDEDGVTHPPFFRANLADVIVVNVSVDGVLNAWFDWDQNGTLSPAEHTLNDLPVYATDNPIEIVPPPFAVPGTIAVRYRFDTAGGLSPIGLAPDGEVEDYKVELMMSVLDFGDLPNDPAPWSFPTHLAEDGPRHEATSGLYLGALIDDESDGQPTIGANGDDNLASDDEDGIDHTSLLAAGADVAITVTASGDGFLNAWADFDNNGTFGAGEKIFHNEPVGSGPNYLVYRAPASLSASAIYQRYRLNRVGGLDYFGPADDGEVEDHYIAVDTEGKDWGDLPDDPGDPFDYPTWNISTGPSHLIVDQCYLGTMIDAESDGQPDMHAEGDDHNGANDEDGIVFTNSPWLPNTMEQMLVTYSILGCPGAELWCWADFEGDLDFNGISEAIVVGELLTGMPHPISFFVPPDLATDRVAVRCRMSTADLTGQWGGPAPDGEVEDYFALSEFLAVQISSFEGFVEDRSVVLQWTTESEEDLAGFRVEHQESGQTWQEAGYLDARGSSDSTTDYDLRLDGMTFGSHHFRLTAINLDGSTEPGPEIEIVVEMADALVLDAAYPNPFNPMTLVQFAVKEAEQTTLDLYSVDGRKVRTVYSGIPEAGISQTFRVDGSGLPSGVYVLRLSTGTHVADRMITLVR